jgi:quinol monooxygenase YgiN
MSNLFVFAKISPKPEYFVDARAAIQSIVEQTRVEDGCIQFELLEADSCLYLYEEWKTESDLELHYKQSYTKAVFEEYQQFLEKPLEVVKMTKVN